MVIEKTIENYIRCKGICQELAESSVFEDKIDYENELKKVKDFDSLIKTEVFGEAFGFIEENQDDFIRISD